jgi:hypothetical protein
MPPRKSKKTKALSKGPAKLPEVPVKELEVPKNVPEKTPTKVLVFDPEKLIVEIEKYEFLYNPNHKDHRDAPRAANSWRQIAATLGISGRYW